MNKWAFVLAVFFCALPVGSQEHAPTIDVCRADLAVWGRASDQNEYHAAQALTIRDGAPNNSAIGRLGLRELHAREKEMFECQDVDSHRAGAYGEVEDFYSSVNCDRFKDFVYRHNLYDQLLKEDSQGDR